MIVKYSTWKDRTVVVLLTRTCVDDFGNEVVIGHDSKQQAWYHLGVWIAVTSS